MNIHSCTIKSGVGLVFTLFFLGCVPEESARAIVLKSIAFHGGQSSWEQAKSITYLKSTELFKASGQLESASTIAYHFNYYSPISKQMRWKRDSIKVQITQNEKEEITGNIKLDDSLKANYKRDFNAAEFVYWQPYKLLEVEFLWNYSGLDTLEDGTAVKVIKIKYPDTKDSPGNTWWFYFNAKTYRLEGNMVKHGTTYAYIRNTEFEDKTGLNLNAKRISYRVDSLRNILFTRAKYDYQVLDFTQNR